MMAQPNDVATIATIGTFDGVHAGHRLLLRTLAEESRRLGLRPLVITFDRHPLTVVAPRRAPLQISGRSRRDRMIAEYGVKVIEYPFTEKVCGLTASQWMERLKNEFGVTHILTGYDNRFGSDGHRLSDSQLRDQALALGITLTVAPELPGVSSSAVRRALEEGRLEEANRMLETPFTLEGKVVHGREMGRTIGFPTANLQVCPDRMIPAPGVYAALATLGDGRRFPAMVNIGNCPTVGEGLPRSIEANLIGFRGDLYDRPLSLSFIRRIRDERRFPGLEGLKEQLARDAVQVQKIIAETD